MALLGLQGTENFQQMAKETIRNVAISVGIIGDLIIKAYQEN